MLQMVSRFFSPGVVVGRRMLWAAWAGQAAVVAAMIAIAVFVIDASDDDPSASVMAIEVALFVIYLVSVAVCGVLGIKRLQSRGRSPWWSLVALIPFIGPPIYIREVGFRRDNDRDASG